MVKAGESAIVVVTVKDGIPAYKFEGPWDVRKALAAERNFSRSYRRYMKGLRMPKQEVVNERIG